MARKLFNRNTLGQVPSTVNYPRFLAYITGNLLLPVCSDVGNNLNMFGKQQVTSLYFFHLSENDGCIVSGSNSQSYHPQT